MTEAVAAPSGSDLQIVGVTKSFGDFTAVDDLTLTIPKGSFFALLGPSGCGKTTTLRMVAGLEEPTRGAVLIGDDDITWRKPYQRPVNTVFQSYALFPHLDIFENVAFGLRRTKTAGIKEKVDAMLELVELTGLARRKPSQLSGGQQQRVAVARALINRPQVLLLDEPLGALDLKLRRQMQLELKRIQTEVGITFVHVTHDQEEAMTMADTVAVMNARPRSSRWALRPTCTRTAATTFVANFLGQVQPHRRSGDRPLRRPRRWSTSQGRKVALPVARVHADGDAVHRRGAAREDLADSSGARTPARTGLNTLEGVVDGRVLHRGEHRSTSSRPLGAGDRGVRAEHAP